MINMELESIKFKLEIAALALNKNKLLHYGRNTELPKYSRLVDEGDKLNPQNLSFIFQRAETTSTKNLITIFAGREYKISKAMVKSLRGDFQQLSAGVTQPKMPSALKGCHICTKSQK